jgi:2-phospho-L-lactate guanylyltransferase
VIAALIPVKELARAKARLASVLDEAGRRELALAMYQDVLAAATACPAIDCVVVVSRDEEALEVARGAGAEGLAEPGGLNEALTSAAEKIAKRGATRIVVLAADLPLASSEAIAAIAEAEADVALVPSADGGTNALALQREAIGFEYGRDSAARHLAAARETGLRSLRLDLPALALDIDTPADLDRLRENLAGAGAQTRAALERTGIARTRTGFA